VIYITPKSQQRIIKAHNCKSLLPFVLRLCTSSIMYYVYCCDHIKYYVYSLLYCPVTQNSYYVAIISEVFGGGFVFR